MKTLGIIIVLGCLATICHAKRSRRTACRMLCNRFVSNVKQRIESIEMMTDEPVANSTALKKFGEEFCKFYAPGNKICHSLMGSHRDIFDGIKKRVKSETICRRISVCNFRSKSKNSRKETSVKWSPKRKCNICKAVVKVADSSLQIFNYTSIKIDDIVKMSCRYISYWKKIQEECRKIVTQIQRVEELLVKELKPVDTCAVLGYCNFTDSKKAVEEDDCGAADKMESFSPFRAALGFAKNFFPRVLGNNGNDSLLSMMKRSTMVAAVGKCIDRMEKASAGAKVRKTRSLDETSCQVCSVLSKKSLVHLQADDEFRDLGTNIASLCGKVKSDYGKHRCKVISAIVGTPESMISDAISPKICNRLPCSLTVRNGVIMSNGKVCNICRMVAKAVGQESTSISKMIDLTLEDVQFLCKTFAGRAEELVCTKITNALKKLLHAFGEGLSEKNLCKKIGLCPNIPEQKPKRLH